jgi:hypothetical protein
MSGMARDPHDDYDFRQEICAWLTANGIDPARTPMSPDATISDGRLTIRQKIQRNGHDVAVAGEVPTETITVPLLVQPAPDIADWLRPSCPACGR